MVRFLSPEWLQSFSEATRVAPSPGKGSEPLCLQHVMHDAPEGEVRYWLRLAPEGLRAGSGEAADPDIVLITDYEGAYALHQGVATAQELAAAGRLTLAGHVERLRDARETLAGVGDPFAALRARTTKDG